MDTKTKTEFDWLVTLNELVKCGDGYYPEDYHWLMKRAQDWPTCACGQLCKALPRNPSGSPQDYRLHNMGTLFYDAVRYRKWRRALDIFNRIEARTTELLTEIGVIKNEVKPKNGDRALVPYCVEPGNVQVFPASSKTFATTASGSTDSSAKQRLHSVHGIPTGN